MAIQKQRKLIITGPEMSTPLEIPMEASGKASIGRGSGNSLQVRHPLVSRQHAEITATPAACQLVDLDSTYGTTVNGEKIAANQPVILSDEDRIELGPYLVVYREEEVEVRERPTATPTAERSMRPRPPKPPPPIPPSEPVNGYVNGVVLPPGLSFTYSRYLKYLPEIYHTEFMGKFLALFESILTPIEWHIDNFDMYLNPRTAPAGFLPWLANWFDVVFDESWKPEQRRQLLEEAHDIFTWRGTKYGLEKLLEIYVGEKPEIIDLEEALEPFTFVVRIPARQQEVKTVLIQRLIEANKPAHTSYTLLFDG